jgi:hypothetical protein
MTSRLRQLTDRAERVHRDREAHRAMMEAVRRQEVLDLQAEAEGIEWIIEAAREIGAGNSVPRLAESLKAAEARWEAGERARWGEAEARRIIESELRLK